LTWSLEVVYFSLEILIMNKFKLLLFGALLLGLGLNFSGEVRADDCGGPEQDECPVLDVYEMKAIKDGPHCNLTEFNVKAELSKNGLAESGVEVTFDYKGNVKKARTDNQGKAEVRMNYSSDNQVVVSARNYTSESLNIDSTGWDNCEVVEGGSEIVELADSGLMVDSWVAVLFIGGFLMVSRGWLRYVKKDS